MAFSLERLNWAAGSVVVGKRAVGRKAAGSGVVGKKEGCWKEGGWKEGRFFILAGLRNFVSWKRILARVHILI